MNLIKYFNVYRGSLTGALQNDMCFIERVSGGPMASTEDRTVTGPFDSVDEAKQSYADRGAQDHFLKTIVIPFKLP